MDNGIYKGGEIKENVGYMVDDVFMLRMIILEFVYVVWIGGSYRIFLWWLKLFNIV